MKQLTGVFRNALHDATTPELTATINNKTILPQMRDMASRELNRRSTQHMMALLR